MNGGAKRREEERSHAKGAEGAEGRAGHGLKRMGEDFFCCSKEGEGSHGDTGSAEGKRGGKVEGNVYQLMRTRPSTKSKWRSLLRTCCWCSRASAAIQMSFSGIGVPAMRK